MLSLVLLGGLLLIFVLFLPPVLLMRLSIIRSYTFPMSLDTVIPISFEHLPFFPFPLYSRVIIPLRHSSGMFFSHVYYF